MKDKGKSISKSNIFFITVIILLFGLRVLNLDADLPPWGIVNYQPMDEGQYATMALTKYNCGSIRLDKKLISNDFLTCAHIRNNVIGNFFVYLGLVLFGDNYYGMRSSSVFFGIINYILFTLILSNLRKKYGSEKNIRKNKNIFLILLMLFAIDFTYTVACRVVETTIYRMFFLQLILYCFTFPKQNETYEQQIRFLIAGFLAVISIFAVYITNIFIFIAIFVTIVFYGLCKGKKYFWNAFVNFVAGAGIAYIFCDLYYNGVWGTSCIVNTMQIIEDFSGTNGYTGGNGIFSVLTLGLNFFATNSNLYNIGLWFVFLLCLPLVVRLAYCKKDINIFFMLDIIVIFLLQTFINEDYIVRKYILIYPLMFYLIYYVTLSYSAEASKEFFSKSRLPKLIYSGGCFTLCIWITLYRLLFIENQTYKDFSIVDKFIVLSQILFLLFAEIIIIQLIFGKGIDLKKASVALGSVLCLGSIITNIYFSLNYVYLYNSYTEKELMQSIGEHVEDDWVYGVYSISFTLYNDLKPIVNEYSVMGKEIAEQGGRWYLDYSDYDFPSEVFYDQSASWVELEKYERNFSTFGKRKSVSIYMIEH